MGRTHPKVVAARRRGLSRRPACTGAAAHGADDIVELDDRYLGVAELAELVRAGRCRAAALRLARAGDVRGAHRGGRGRPPGGLHGVPARDRAAGRRHRARGAPARSGGVGGGAAPGAQRARTGRRAGRAGRRGRRRSCCGRRWPAATGCSRPSWPPARPAARRSSRRDGPGRVGAGRRVRPPAPAHRRRRVCTSTRRGTAPAPRARLLRRRRRAGAGRRLPGTEAPSTTTCASSTWRSCSRPRRPTAGSTTGGGRPDLAGQPPLRSRTAGAARCGVSAPRSAARAAAARPGAGRVRPRGRAALAASARDGVRRARRRRGARRAAAARPGAGADHGGSVGRSAGPPPTRRWPWPQPRLSYANAALPEALLAAGAALDSTVPRRRRAAPAAAGCSTGRPATGTCPSSRSGGRGPGETGPGFDQQPIEVAALADACARALPIDRATPAGPRASTWPRRGSSAPTTPAPPCYDPASGGGFDGLERRGRNENQGAESTLALLSTLQQARSLACAEPAGDVGGPMTPCVTRTRTCVLPPTRRGCWLGCSSPGTSSPTTAGRGRPGCCRGSWRCPRTRSGAACAGCDARYADRHRDLPGVLAGPLRADRAPRARTTSSCPPRAAASSAPGSPTSTRSRRPRCSTRRRSRTPTSPASEPGECRFVLSLRAVGEGHLSSVEFRTGVVGPGDALRIDDPGPHIEAGRIAAHRVRPRGCSPRRSPGPDIDRESGAFVVARLARTLRRRRARGGADGARRRAAHPAHRGARTAELARRIAACSYEVEFPPASDARRTGAVAARARSESHGIEDARFVRDRGRRRRTGRPTPRSTARRSPRS